MSIWDLASDLIHEAHEGQPWTECVYPFYCDEEAPLVSPPPAPIYGPWEGPGEFYDVSWPCGDWKAQQLWDSNKKRFTVVHFVNKISGKELWTVGLQINPEVWGSDLWTPAMHNAKYPDMPVLDYVGSENNPTGCYTIMKGPDEDPIVHAPVIGIPPDKLPPELESWKQPGSDPKYADLPSFEIDYDPETGESVVTKTPGTGGILAAGVSKGAVIAVVGGLSLLALLALRKKKKRKKRSKKRGRR